MHALTGSWLAAGALLVGAALPRPCLGQPGQPSFGTTLFQLDLSRTPVGELPGSIDLVNGILEVVLKNGVPMLKASALTEFRITLQPPGQVLPPDFTLEFDLIPKLGSNPQDLSVEGTSTINQGDASAHVLWHATGSLSVIGGGGDTYDTPMPEDFQASLPGVLTKVVLEVEGPTIRLYTNGRRLYTLQKQFVRGAVLRVYLGAQNGGTEAVYLASLRVTAGSGLVTSAAGAGGGGSGSGGGGSGVGTGGGGSIANQSQGLSGTANRIVPNVAVTQGTAGPVVTWAAVGGAASYTVKRWKRDDLACCNATSAVLSGPPWQDGALPVAGTYVYQVTANSAAWTATGQAQFVQFQGQRQIASVAPPPPPPPPTSSGSVPAAGTGTIRSGSPGGTASTGLLVPPAPRTILVGGISAAGGSSPVLPQTIVLGPVTATGGYRPPVPIVLPTTLTLTGFTAQGGYLLIAPQTLRLAGWTAVGSNP